MQKLTRLFRLLELTRCMPQYGYALAGISKAELSDLAQHSYLVTMMAWQLAKLAQANGATLNVEKILEMSLVHELGELFGGDIAMPYYRANPAARPLAKAFEAENYRFITTFFNNPHETLNLGAEAEQSTTDEAIIFKIADYVECTHYKLRHRAPFGSQSRELDNLFAVIIS